MLGTKSLTELRGIAQSLEVPDVFQKDKPQLLRAIEMKQQAVAPVQKVAISPPQYDARLMTLPPSKKSLRHDIEMLIAPYVERGLRITFDEERWYMAFGKRTDEGTMRMPLKVVLRCAEKILE